MIRPKFEEIGKKIKANQNLIIPPCHWFIVQIVYISTYYQLVAHLPLISVVIDLNFDGTFLKKNAMSEIVRSISLPP